MIHPHPNVKIHHSGHLCCPQHYSMARHPNKHSPVMCLYPNATSPHFHITNHILTNVKPNRQATHGSSQCRLPRPFALRTVNISCPHLSCSPNSYSRRASHKRYKEKARCHLRSYPNPCHRRDRHYRNRLHNLRNSMAVRACRRALPQGNQPQTTARN